jgi:seryl-tRNA synthetase
MCTCEVALPVPAHEMAQEEILKHLAHVSSDIVNPRFAGQGKRILFDAPDSRAGELSMQVEIVSRKIERSLRSLERKIVFRSAAAEPAAFPGDGSDPGIQFMGVGQVALRGLPLRLLRYFDRVFEEFGSPWQAEPLRAPTLIPVGTLARCDYLRSFPHILTFAAHLTEDHASIDSFRSRHAGKDALDDAALRDMAQPEAGLSPAVCYHAYSSHAGQEVPAGGLVYGMCGKCFRYEASNLRDLRRLWDFTMREVVFLGARDDVLARRTRATTMMEEFLDGHALIGEIRTASDPFFVAPDAVAKTFFQLSSDTKYEVALSIADGEKLAVGSLNYHSDFFGRAFDVTVAGAGPMHSVCVAFGLERWVYAFLVQHGNDPARWPDRVRRAPEFTR